MEGSSPVYPNSKKTLFVDEISAGGCTRKTQLSEIVLPEVAKFPIFQIRNSPDITALFSQIKVKLIF